MVVYKEYYDKTTKEVKYKEYNVKDPDKINILKSNCTEFLYSFHYTIENTEESVNRYNESLKEGFLTVHICKDCKLFFFITKNEKEWYEDKGMELPKRCKLCRMKRKKEKENGRH